MSGEYRLLNAECRTRTERLPRIPPRLALWQAAFAVMIWAGATSAAQGITPAVLVGSDLRPHPISLSSLRDGVLSYFDANRDLQREPVDQFVQLRAIGLPAAARADRWSVTLLDLVDGRRLAGRWAGSGPDGQSVVWDHTELGRIRVPVNRIRGLVLEGDPPLRGAAPSRDMVSLVNGDVVRGYLAKVTDEGLMFAAEGSSEVLALPLGRVRGLFLAYPRRNPELWGQPPPGQDVVWLADGSRLFASDIEMETDQIRLTMSLPGQVPSTVVLGVDRLRRVDFTGAGWRILDLVDLPMRILEGGEVFYLPMPPRVDGRTVRMHAPVKVAYDLPEAVVRFSATAELAIESALGGFEDLKAAGIEWSDLEVIVRGGAATIHPPGVVGEAAESDGRYRLHARRSQVQINVPIKGQRLTIEVVSGVNGPILDRLRLRDAVLLVRRDGSTSSGDEDR